MDGDRPQLRRVDSLGLLRLREAKLLIAVLDVRDGANPHLEARLLWIIGANKVRGGWSLVAIAWSGF